jgi:putative redox protein
MPLIKASIEKELFRIEIKSPTGNVIFADEPPEKGGKDKGFSPKELLAAALGSCTCATVRMFADRKARDLQKINITVELIEEEGKTTFSRKLQFEGNLDEEQHARLLKVADTCPVHKILTHPIVVETTLI